MTLRDSRHTVSLMMMELFTARTVLLLGCLAVAGCGASGDATRDARSEAELPRQDPALVAPGSPGAAVRRLWTLIEKGAAPAAVDSYLPRVRRRAGVSALAGGLSDAAFQLRTLATPVVIQRLNTSRGALLTVLAQQRKNGDRSFRGTFLLQRVAGRWLIAYDTLLATAIPGYVTNLVQASVRPGARPGAKAVAAGLRAASDFRTALFERDELSPAGR